MMMLCYDAKIKQQVRRTFFSISTECTEAAAPAPLLIPSSGALYRPRPESSCHSPESETSVLVRVKDSTMGSSRCKCSMVLLRSCSLSFPFSTWDGKRTLFSQKKNITSTENGNRIFLLNTQVPTTDLQPTSLNGQALLDLAQDLTCSLNWG